jgi:hypothetical protein
MRATLPYRDTTTRTHAIARAARWMEENMITIIVAIIVLALIGVIAFLILSSL